jgi:hypothetical protein
MLRSSPRAGSLEGKASIGLTPGNGPCAEPKFAGGPASRR